MSIDVDTQIRGYAEFFEEIQIPVSVEETLDRATLVPTLPDTRGLKRQRRRWPIALAVAVGVVVVALNLIFATTRSQEPITSTTLPPSGVTNGWIAYSAQDEGDSNLFVIGDSDIFLARAGESPSRVFGAHGDGVDQTCPTFSPDGTKLAYAEGESWSGQAGSREVVVVAFDGSYDELLRFGVTPIYPGCITWSLDSTMVAYQSWTGRIQIGALDGETHNLRGPSNGAWAGVPYGQADLEWSPEGSSITVVKGGQLFEVPLDGGQPVKLASHNNWDASSLAWSPDGSLMAIRWNTNPSPQTIHIIAADGGEVGSFEANQADQWYDNQSDAWSPDGTRLAYLEKAQSSIAVLDPETGDVTHLALDPLPHSLQAGPIWSADGSQLLVATTDMESNDAALVAVPVEPDQEPVVIQVLEQPVDGFNGLSWQTIRP